MPLNSTYWAPVDAHDPVRVQQIMLGLTKSSAEKMDLALARDTKICKLPNALIYIKRAIL